MKKFMAILMTVLLGVAATLGLTACGSSKEKLYVYTNAGFAPYEYVNEYGEVVGIDIDIMKEIASVLGYDVVINDIDFDNIFIEVPKSKMAVGAAGITKKSDRDEIMLASDVYASSQQYVIAPVGSFEAGETVTVEQVYNKFGASKIGVQRGTTGSDLIEEYLEDVSITFESTVITYPNAFVASDDIGSTVGAVIIDKLPAESISNAKSGLACWAIEAEVESYVLYFNKEATELVAKVNTILSVMKDNGVLAYYNMKHTGGGILGD